MRIINNTGKVESVSRLSFTIDFDDFHNRNSTVNKARLKQIMIMAKVGGYNDLLRWLIDAEKRKLAVIVAPAMWGLQ